MLRPRSALLLILLAACASSSPAPRPVRPSANVITRAEIDASAAPDLLELVVQARPHWIPRSNPDAVDLYFGQSRQGGVVELRIFHPRDVDSIEYLSAAQAAFRLPDARGRPVIRVIPRASR